MERSTILLGTTHYIFRLGHGFNSHETQWRSHKLGAQAISTKKIRSVKKSLTKEVAHWSTIHYSLFHSFVRSISFVRSSIRWFIDSLKRHSFIHSLESQQSCAHSLNLTASTVHDSCISKPFLHAIFLLQSLEMFETSGPALAGHWQAKMTKICKLLTSTHLSKEVWKLNFRQYGDMKMQSRAAGAQRWRKSEERRCRCAKR